MTVPADLMAAAKGQTGLEDFGDDSFREGLEILVRSLRDEARLNATGEAVIYPRLVCHLVNRLQIEDWYRRHPETEDVADRRHHCSVWACPAPARPSCRSCWPRTRASATCASGSRRSRVRRRRQSTGPDPRVPALTARAGRHEGARPHRRQRADGVPGPHGAGLQDADVPRLRSHPHLRRMGYRCRPHVHLPATSDGC